MGLRKKGKGGEANGVDRSLQLLSFRAILLMLESQRLAVFAASAGSGTDEARTLRAASDALAERALKGPGR